MQHPAIQIENLWFAYGGARVLEQVNLTLSAGEFLAVLGPNGGGKSTLLRLLLGLVRPGGGSLKVLGQDPGQAGGRIGYLPQFTHVSASFPITVLGAVALGLVRPGFSGLTGWLNPAARRAEREAALLALSRVGLADQAGRRLSDLSGGQRQRVFIARAIVSGPELLLLARGLTRGEIILVQRPALGQHPPAPPGLFLTRGLGLGIGEAAACRSARRTPLGRAAAC